VWLKIPAHLQHVPIYLVKSLVPVWVPTTNRSVSCSILYSVKTCYTAVDDNLPRKCRSGVSSAHCLSRRSVPGTCCQRCSVREAWQSPTTQSSSASLPSHHLEPGALLPLSWPRHTHQPQGFSCITWPAFNIPLTTTSTTITVLQPFFRDHPGEPVELLHFMVQGKINRGRHNIQTNQCPVPTSTIPHYFYRPVALPAAQPTHPPSWSSSNLYQLLPSTVIHRLAVVVVSILHHLFLVFLLTRNLELCLLP